MKRFLAVLIVVTMLLSSMVATASAIEIYMYQSFTNDETYILGDVNDDGAVNALDSMAVRQTIAGVAASAINIEAADFDANDACSAPDAYSLKLCIAGASSTKDFEPNQIHKLTIAGTDVRELSIVVPADSTKDDNTYFAATNLMKYIRQVNGVERPIVWGTATTDKAVYFNSVALDSELGQELGIDGYKITDCPFF